MFLGEPLDPPLSGRFVAVVPLIRGIPPKGGGGFVCSGEPPCFPIGNENGSPSGRFLNPPLSGGQKALPLRGRLASLSGMEPPLDSPLSGRFVAVVPLIRGIPPKGGGGFVFRGAALLPYREGTPPLIPPYQGGKKLSPFGVALLPYREWKRPLSGRFVAVVPLTRGIPPKGGGGFVCSGEPPCFPIGNETGSPSGRFLNPPLSGGQKALPLRGRLASLSGMEPPLDPPLIREVCCRCPPDKGEYPEGGRGFCLFGGVPLLPYREENPP